MPFYKPYEPDFTEVAEAPQKSSSQNDKQEPMVAILLGGGRKVKIQDR